MQKNIVFYLFICFVSIYLLTASGINFYYTDASQMRAQVTKSIIERGDFSITEGVGFIGNDKRKYSVHGIGSALLAIPFYFLGDFIGVREVAVLIMNLLFGACTVVLVFVFSISLGYSKRASLLVSLCYGLGTAAWPMAKHPFDHTIETFFILLSVYCMYLSMIYKRLLHLILSAFFVGIAFITRAVSILVVPPLLTLIIIYQLKQHEIKAKAKKILKSCIVFSIVFFPFLCIFLWYNYYRFGSIYETGYHLVAERLGVNFFTGTKLFSGLSGFLISPGKGFFFYSPIAILFFFSIKSFLKQHLELGISFILLIISYLLFLSKNIYWHGDFAWGPRYIFVLTPFFIIPIGGLFDYIISQQKKLLKSVIYLLFTLSLIIQIAAISVDFQKYYTNLKYQGKITVIQGDGVPPILVPPAETYYNWHKSPLLVQFKFIHEMAEGIKDYRYAKLPDNATDAEKMKVEPIMNIFDFWWLYEYYLYGNTWGFTVASVLFLIAIYTALRLWKLTSMSPQDIRLCVEESMRR